MSAEGSSTGGNVAMLRGGPAAPALIPPAMTDEDVAALGRAVTILERSSLAARLNAALGKQIDWATQLVPGPVLSLINATTMKALTYALKAAVRSLRGDMAEKARPRLHVAAAALTGAAGGVFGLGALPVELPVSTSIMLRSIAAIARAEGEDLDDPATLLACLEVFALGTGGDKDPMGTGGYLATRAVLAKSLREAARFAIQRGVIDEAAPAIVRLTTQIATRFGAAVGQKTISQAVPVLGAITGAAINAAFTDHFQNVAQAHFTVRRLERLYGVEPVQALFAELKGKVPSAEREPRASPARA